MLSRLKLKLPDKHHRAMWKVFSSSMVMLAIAMMAALYSSSAGRDGRVVAAGLSALVALAIAVWVCIRFVPRLAASVEWDWLPFFSHYHVTREGWMYFIAIIVVVFAAINTSNNLLYMVLSALLAVLLLSGALSGLNFRFMRVEVRMPERCYAGDAFPISIRVHNEKRVFPSFSLQFVSREGAPIQFATFYVPAVRARQHVHQTGQGLLARRGRYVMREIESASRYPFGFFLKDRKYRVEAGCICYPRIIPQERMNLSILDIQGSSQRFERGLGNDLYTIRDYMPADSARHVHWKASAKTATLKTREYAAEESRRVVLAFDRYGHPDDAGRFEELVSYAASLACHLIADGVEVALVSDEWQTGHGASEIQMESILEYLALVEMSPSAGAPARAPDGVLTLSLREGRKMGSEPYLPIFRDSKMGK